MDQTDHPPSSWFGVLARSQRGTTLKKISESHHQSSLTSDGKITTAERPNKQCFNASQRPVPFGESCPRTLQKFRHPVRIVLPPGSPFAPQRNSSPWSPLIQNLLTPNRTARQFFSFTTEWERSTQSLMNSM